MFGFSLEKIAQALHITEKSHGPIPMHPDSVRDMNRTADRKFQGEMKASEGRMAEQKRMASIEERRANSKAAYAAREQTREARLGFLEKVLGIKKADQARKDEAQKWKSTGPSKSWYRDSKTDQQV